MAYRLQCIITFGVFGRWTTLMINEQYIIDGGAAYIFRGMRMKRGDEPGRLISARRGQGRSNASRQRVK